MKTANRKLEPCDGSRHAGRCSGTDWEPCDIPKGPRGYAKRLCDGDLTDEDQEYEASLKASVSTPKFVLDKIASIRTGTFQDEKPALVDVNAPKALIQCTGNGQLQGIAWMLKQPLYATAPDVLSNLKEVVRSADMARPGIFVPEFIESCREIIRKAEGGK